MRNFPFRLGVYHDTNTGNNMAPFSVMYKRHMVKRLGTGYAVTALGARKVLGHFNNPNEARAYIDALDNTLSIPNGMLGEEAGASNKLNWIFGGLAVLAFTMFNKTPRQEDYRK